MRGAFLDRDGTLIEDPGYLGDPAAVRLLPGAAAAVAALRGAGYQVVVVTNQSGVARGLFPAAAVAAVHQRLARLLQAERPEARVAAFYHCPHGPASPCPCRKPRPGLLLQAAAELGIDLQRSAVIGDQPRDLQAGAAAGCPTGLRIGAGAHPSLLAAVTRLLHPEAQGGAP